MNLINDPWIPIIRADGTQEQITPWQIAETDNPVIDIAAPRPDFQGALYQFLIGLLQTAFAPEDQDKWLEYWYNQPSTYRLKECFSPLAEIFELLTDEGSPAFLQDMEMQGGEQKPISSLLIEAPGGKTLKDNLDHFVKGDSAHAFCDSCAATALFTLQTNAPSGGVGHRVGLRGGGPLTTLLLPSRPVSLWCKLWLNVLTEEELAAGKSNTANAAIFPWSAPTRVSDKSGGTTTPEDTNPLQMYWGMPRRIRLDQGHCEPGTCSLCGKPADQLLTHFHTKNYGVNYDGPWVHPLTPYRFDRKNQNPPLSLKGQQGGLGYRHWLSFNWLDDSNGDRAALNVRACNEDRYTILDDYSLILWCFGYDMDNMKARCWYEQQMPIVHVDPDYQPLFIQFTANLINAARDVVKELRSQVKAAWFSRPKDAKGDTSMIDSMFWQYTEPAFYQQLFSLANQSSDTRQFPVEVAQHWLKTLRTQTLEVFDYWVLEGDAEDMDMKRITKARRDLEKKLKNTKSLKDLDQIANATAEVV